MGACQARSRDTFSLSPEHHPAHNKENDRAAIYRSFPGSIQNQAQLAEFSLLAGEPTILHVTAPIRDGTQHQTCRYTTRNIKTLAIDGGIKRSLERVRDICSQTESASNSDKAKGYEENYDVNVYNDGMKPHYPVNEVKKGIGVSLSDTPPLSKLPDSRLSSSRLLLDADTAAAGSPLLDGGVALTVLARCVTGVVSSTLGWGASVNSKSATPTEEPN